MVDTLQGTLWAQTSKLSAWESQQKETTRLIKKIKKKVESWPLRALFKL